MESIDQGVSRGREALRPAAGSLHFQGEGLESPDKSRDLSQEWLQGLPR